MRRNKIIFVSVMLGIGAAAIALLAWPEPSATVAATPQTSALHRVIIISQDTAIRSDEVQSRLCRASANCENCKDAVDVVVLQSGDTPSRPIRADVQTDTNCMPDPYGISHCINQLELADGRSLVVRHDHNMRLYPCLTPGEVVEVETAQTL